MKGKKNLTKKELAGLLQSLREIEREKHHPLLHEIHRKHKISKKTLFYIKEYGPHTHVTKTIIKESIKILVLASLVSSFGGLMLEHTKEAFVVIVPLVILLPALNDLIGDFGTIISSKFSAMLHEGKGSGNPAKNKDLRKLLAQVLLLAMITGLISTAAALLIAGFSWQAFSLANSIKIFFIVIVDVLVLVYLMFAISIIAGKHFFRKQEDPNNFLIPITTSIADFGNMAILAVMVAFLF